MTAPGLQISGMRKAFGATVAVDDAVLTVEPGTFWGLVGPNGAGKTTLLSLATGLLEPDAGSAQVAGFDIWHPDEEQQAKRLLGVLPDGLALPTRLTGRELLRYLGLLRALPATVVDERSDELLTAFDLHGAERTLIADYSTGMRKKIGLATALLHGPQVLVLDEPFEAVDPLSAVGIQAILDGFVRGGGTVLMSTHVMALVEQLCDHVAVMAAGRILRTGTVAEVAAGHTLQDAFLDLVGAPAAPGGLSWFGH